MKRCFLRELISVGIKIFTSSTFLLFPCSCSKLRHPSGAFSTKGYQTIFPVLLASKKQTYEKFVGVKILRTAPKNAKKTIFTHTKQGAGM